MCVRLQLLTSHGALFLLKSSLAMPKWLYMLRTLPCFFSGYLNTVDVQQREASSGLLNILLTDEFGTQSSMPVRWGGLGLRSLTDFAHSAYLSSLELVRPLLADILPPVAFDYATALGSQAIISWHTLRGELIPSPIMMLVLKRMTSILRNGAEVFIPARQGSILNFNRVISQYLNGAKLRLSDLHNDDSRCRTAGCSLTSYPGLILD